MPHHHHKLPGPPRLNPALCASAPTRLAWAFVALALLWITIRWALS